MLSITDLLNQFDVKNATIVSSAALVANGLTNHFSNFLQLLTDKESVSEIRIGPIEYLYIPEYNAYPDVVTIGKDSSITLPTAERAIIEYYKDQEHCSLDDLYQACYSYHWMNGSDTSKLEEVAVRAGLRPGEITELFHTAVEDVATDG